MVCWSWSPADFMPMKPVIHQNSRTDLCTTCLLLGQSVAFCFCSECIISCPQDYNSGIKISHCTTNSCNFLPVNIGTCWATLLDFCKYMPVLAHWISYGGMDWHSSTVNWPLMPSELCLKHFISDFNKVVCLSSLFWTLVVPGCMCRVQ